LTETRSKKASDNLFMKNGHQLYMLDMPMELITNDWKAIARVMVIELTVGHNLTKGTYKVLRVYSDEEVEVFSGTLTPFDEAR